MTPAERLDAAGRWLVTVGGTAAPGELGAALGLNRARQAETLAALESRSFVERNKREVRLTQAGWAQFGVTEPSDFGDVLGAALEGWPYAHRAFVGLLASTIVARHHLAAERPKHWLGFMAIGETGSGKSSAVELTAELFGLDPVRVSVLLGSATEGAVYGRREREDGVWRFVPASLTREPLAFFDEYDKADDGLRRAALTYFQGLARTMAEDELVALAPVPVLAANPPARGDRYAMLRQEYRRRSVVLDTAYMRGKGEVFEELMSRRAGDGAVLSLDRLKPPSARLEPEAVEVLKLVRLMLTEQGREEFPGVEWLELAALGRLALLGTGDHTAAALATLLDYLTVTETVPGQVVEGWQLNTAALQQYSGLGGTSLADVFEQAQADREQARREVRRSRVRVEVEDLDLVHDRGELAERLRLAAESINGHRITFPALKPEAAGARSALRKLQRQVLDTRARGRLDDLAVMAADRLRQAESLCARQEAERLRAEAERQQRADEKRHARALAAQARKDAAVRDRLVRAQLTRELQVIVTEAKALERLYERSTTRPVESPFALLRDYRVGGEYALLEYVPPRPRARPQGFWATAGTVVAEAFAWPDLGTWRVAGRPDLLLPGTASSCSVLSAWGPYTRAVLAPVLRQLHDGEDQLRARLGQQARQRPVIADVPLPSPALAGARQPRALAAG